MGKIEINTARYWELIDLKEKRKREGLGLTEQEESQLFRYQVNLSATVFFKNLKKYSELIEAYVEKKIGLRDFCSLFFQLWSEDRDQFKLLEAELKQNSVSTISVDSRAERFTGLMGNLFAWNDNLDALLDEYNDYEELVEEKYLEVFQKLYLEMKELLSED